MIDIPPVEDHWNMFHWPGHDSSRAPSDRAAYARHALPGSWVLTNPGLRVSACGCGCSASISPRKKGWDGPWFPWWLWWACTRGTILASCFPEPSPNLNERRLRLHWLWIQWWSYYGRSWPCLSDGPGGGEKTCQVNYGKTSSNAHAEKAVKPINWDLGLGLGARSSKNELRGDYMEDHNHFADEDCKTFSTVLHSSS